MRFQKGLGTSQKVSKVFRYVSGIFETIQKAFRCGFRWRSRVFQKGLQQFLHGFQKGLHGPYRGFQNEKITTFHGVGKGLQRVLTDFQCQGIFPGVSRTFHGGFRGILQTFQGFQGVSGALINFFKVLRALQSISSSFGMFQWRFQDFRSKTVSGRVNYFQDVSGGFRCFPGRINGLYGIFQNVSERSLGFRSIFGDLMEFQESFRSISRSFREFHILGIVRCVSRSFGDLSGFFWRFQRRFYELTF